MMYLLAWSTGFRRGFKRATRKAPWLQEKIFSTLEQLSENPFVPHLKTHKLHGKLAALWLVKSNTIVVSFLLLKMIIIQVKTLFFW
jgi:mRNA-degrading endonuclease YafQ of YafQ-DinJ toxin-antitoxin module